MNIYYPKLLIFIDWFEPAYKAGGPIKSIKNLVANIDAYFEIFIFTSDRDLGDKENFANIKQGEWIKYANNTYIFYNNINLISLFNINKLVRLIKPNVIYVNSMFSYEFSVLPLFSVCLCNHKVKFILAPRGMLHSGAMLQKSSKKRFYLFILSFLRFSMKINFHCTDLNEVLHVKRYFKNYSSISLIPNINDRLVNRILAIQKEIGKINCIYLARIEKKKNLIFLLDTFRSIRSIQLTLHIYGWINNSSYHSECVNLIGLLPENIKVYFHQAIRPIGVIKKLLYSHLFILPTLGENYGHAIIESLSVGRPVLISDKTPWKNLKQYHAGWELPLSDKQAWIDAIEEAASWDQAAFDRHCQGALDYARAHTNVEELVEKYKEMFGG